MRDKATTLALKSASKILVAARPSPLAITIQPLLSVGKTNWMVMHLDAPVISTTGFLAMVANDYETISVVRYEEGGLRKEWHEQYLSDRAFRTLGLPQADPSRSAPSQHTARKVA